MWLEKNNMDFARKLHKVEGNFLGGAGAGDGSWAGPDFTDINCTGAVGLEQECPGTAWLWLLYVKEKTRFALKDAGTIPDSGNPVPQQPKTCMSHRCS